MLLIAEISSLFFSVNIATQRLCKIGGPPNGSCSVGYTIGFFKTITTLPKTQLILCRPRGLTAAGSWLALLSASALAVCAPHGGRSEPFQTSSGHVTPHWHLTVACEVHCDLALQPGMSLPACCVPSLLLAWLLSR